MQYHTKYHFLIHVKSGNHSIISGDLEKSWAEALGIITEHKMNQFKYIKVFWKL